MAKLKLTAKDIKSCYDKGENITQLLRSELGSVVNSEQIIEIAYDLQSGTYIEETKRNSKHRISKWEYAGEMARIISEICPNPQSFLKAGVGEAVTLVATLKQLDCSIPFVRGFDLCWSRVAYGRTWLQENKLENVRLCTGSLFNIPFGTNSFDVVVTSHSMEPNGGKEKQILRELYRVAKKYLILFEPSYECADEEGKMRMQKLGYVTHLVEHSMELGYKVVEYRPLSKTLDAKNPTSLLAIRKVPSDQEENSVDYACPKTKVKLIDMGECYYSPEALCIYPVMFKIPCLREENSIIASKILDLYDNIPKGMM